MNKNEHSEKDLLLLVAQGDQDAYAALFEIYWDQVYGAALRLTKSPEQSKDLAQDAFLKLWAQREKLKEIRNLPSFLYTMIRNQVHDLTRTKVFRESNREFLHQYFAYSESSPRELLEQKEVEMNLQRAIDRLAPKLQEVIRLHRLEGLSHEQIAARMGITPQSSKTYMVRALDALRKEMRKNTQQVLLFILWLIHP